MHAKWKRNIRMTFNVGITALGIGLAQQSAGAENRGALDNIPRRGSGVTIRVPEEAKIRYGLGNAPLYFVYYAYTSRLGWHIADNNVPAMEQEAETLGLSMGELEELYQTLNQFHYRHDDAANKVLSTVCRPILVTQYIDDGDAREALRRLDDSDELRNNIILGIVEEIKVTFGEQTAARLEARVEEIGKFVDFTKVDVPKLVELTEGGNYAAHLKAMCSSM